MSGHLNSFMHFVTRRSHNRVYQQGLILSEVMELWMSSLCCHILSVSWLLSACKF